MGIVLRDVIDGDVVIFFEQQLDPDANHIATRVLGLSIDEIKACAGKVRVHHLRRGQRVYQRTRD